MSGGSLNYFYCALQDHIGDFGDKELDMLVKDLAELFHAREWYLSADTGEGSWREARDKFKEKWFTQHGRIERVTQILEEICGEVRETFGINHKYCKNCKHWSAEGGDSHYGKCAYTKTCLMHRSERCDRFEEAEGGEENEGL